MKPSADKVFKKNRRQRGAALLVILAVFSIIIPLVQGVWLDSQIEYQFNRYRMNKLQARYNAQSGIGLSLLRIYIFKGIEKSLEDRWKETLRPLLDRIWSFPFAWPFLYSEELLESDKQNIESLTSQSFLKGSYRASITPEDGLLDLNELSSSFEPLRNLISSTTFQLLMNAREERAELKDKYKESDFTETLQNLSDWTDLDNESQNGGSEELIEEGKKPLNRSFISIEEIKKVPGVSQEIYNILKTHITVYGAKTFNINYASKEVLSALEIPEELVEQILSRTQSQSEYYKPFSNLKDFCDFMNELNFSFCEEQERRQGTLDMLSFDYPIAFRIKSTGEYRGQTVGLEALLYDLSSSALNYQEIHYKEKERKKLKETGAEQEESGNDRENEQKEEPKEPKIDYSFHRSLIIMYLKESY